MSLTLAFVMDPMQRIHPAVDTSFAFMLAARARGHRVVHVEPKGVALENDRVLLRGHVVDVQDKEGAYYEVREPIRIPADQCAAIFIRTDPPFDEAYLTLTWMLSLAEERGVRIINSPRGLRNASEHLYSLYFAGLFPEQIVTSSLADIRDFVDKMGGEAIAKPIDGHGGYGVVRLHNDDSNLNAIVDLLTHEGAQPIIAQRYLPVTESGDKRLILINGELRGAVLRVPQGGDHRGNVHVGGTTRACEITAADRRIAETMGERLRADGLFFVGLDVIDGQLIEVNVTSPTLIRELLRHGGPDLSVEVIDAVEQGAQ